MEKELVIIPDQYQKRSALFILGVTAVLALLTIATFVPDPAGTTALA